MDDRITKLKTPEDCEKFAKNAERLDRPDLVEDARRRAVELRAKDYGSVSDAEKECLQAVYAYEEVLSKKNGKRTRASRTWQMIERHGILQAAERAVNRPVETVAYRALIEMGLRDFAFEAVILRHPDAFSQEAAEVARQRLRELEGDA
jgi:hypothetical protein